MDPDGGGARVWSLGHRNVQGLAWDRSGRLWASEFGQNTRDEVNLIRRGRNYGWPLVEGTGDTRGGRFTNPKVTWATSDASPSGAAIIGSNLYVAALRGECVWRIPLRGASLGTPVRMLAGRYGRIRTVGGGSRDGRCGWRRPTATGAARRGTATTGSSLCEWPVDSGATRPVASARGTRARD